MPVCVLQFVSLLVVKFGVGHLCAGEREAAGREDQREELGEGEETGESSD